MEVVVESFPSVTARICILRQERRSTPPSPTRLQEEVILANNYLNAQCCSAEYCLHNEASISYPWGTISRGYFRAEKLL